MSNGHHTILPRGAEPCVWMSAGLISYRLCDRDFDCEHCPLDAALGGRRGGSEPGPVGQGVAAPWQFPPDRDYSPGHVWRQPTDDGETRRFGLDALAAGLSAPVRTVRFPAPGSDLRAGDSFCELETEIGTLSVRAEQPMRGVAGNPEVEEHPALLAEDPYGRGWLVEARGEAEPRRGPGPSEAPGKRAEHDLRRFRRAVALRLLVDRDLGPMLNDGGEPITDLRGMLGSAAYRSIVAEFVGGGA